MRATAKFARLCAAGVIRACEQAIQYGRGPDMDARTSRTIQTREQFVELLSECGNVRASCAALGLQRSTVYAWRNVDANFAAKWDHALQLGADCLEDEARKRAMIGSDRLLIFLLRGLKPDKYREKQQVTADKDASLELRQLPRDELLRRLEALRR